MARTAVARGLAAAFFPPSAGSLPILSDKAEGDFMARRHFAFWVAAAIAAAFGPSTAFGQRAPSYGGGTALQPQLQKEDFTGKGEFEAAGSAGLKAVLDGKPWLIQFDPKVKVNVSGSATVDVLTPGMFVKFRAEVDKKGKAPDEITNLEIFTPGEKNPIGATPAGGGNAFETSAPKKGPAATPTSYDIAGKVTSLKKGAIIVACPGMTVHGQLSSDPTITINAADLRFASPGDKIVVKGWHPKGQEGKGYATEVEVQMANTLSPPAKKGAHAGKTADKAADSADSATSGDKKPAKAAAKPADPKAADAKAGDTKGTDAKGADPKAAAGKTADPDSK
jgi:hypothetical protein